MSKLNKFLLEHDFKTISFMHNNSIETDEFIICGTRGWKCRAMTNLERKTRKYTTGS